jgi:hypothetical protein
MILNSYIFKNDFGGPFISKIRNYMINPPCGLPISGSDHPFETQVWSRHGGIPGKVKVNLKTPSLSPPHLLKAALPWPLTSRSIMEENHRA